MLLHHLRILNSFRRLQSFRFVCKYVFAMDKAYLRLKTDEDTVERFEITFQCDCEVPRVKRQFNFCRNLNEPVGALLTRISKNVEKIASKKRKKKNSEGIENSPIQIKPVLTEHGVEIDAEVLCRDVFQENGSSEVILKLLGSDYRVIVNSPWVDSISLSTSFLVNFPTYPLKFETVFTDRQLSDFIWYKSLDKKTWSQAGTGFVYYPTNSDTNCYLKLHCIPKNQTSDGPEVECVSDNQVQASPGVCPFETRHQFTKEFVRGKEFRVITYNILADYYCDSDFTRTVLHPYCPPYALTIDYRQQLFIKELIGYHADIICLQEVDKKVYKYGLDPVFNTLGYASTFDLKGGTVAEGLACIFNKSRFKLLKSTSVVLSEQLTQAEYFRDIWNNISTNELLSKRALERSTSVQITVLESVEYDDEIVLVVNTHLYSRPDADHIRLLQGCMAIRHVDHVLKNVSQEYKSKRISILFCGDFNSTPECGIYQLYTTGSVSEDCQDWKSNEEEAVKNLSMTQQHRLASACGTPQYTNYTSVFFGCLDYIFYDKDKLEVVQVVPLPSHEEVTLHTAIPSVVFPSDHISLVADLRWT